MVEYNPFMDEVLYGDPYPVYARMRREDPVYYVEEYDAWFLSRFAIRASAASFVSPDMS